MLFRGCVLDIGLPNRELYEMFFKKCDLSTTFDCKKKKIISGLFNASTALSYQSLFQIRPFSMIKIGTASNNAQREI